MTLGFSESTFLPFMCRLRVLEVYIGLSCPTVLDFQILSSLMASLRTSLTSPATLEHLEFNIQFSGTPGLSFSSLYDFMRVADAWRHLDSITTHPAGSRLQRVDINIDYAFHYHGYRLECDKNEILKAVLDGLPLLRTKGILFVKAVERKRVEKVCAHFSCLNSSHHKLSGTHYSV